MLLHSADRAQRVPASADTVLISYLADRAWGFHPELGINMADTTRVLVHFDLTAIDAVATPTKVELLLVMHNSRVPVVAPFELGVYAVREAWLERTDTRDEGKDDDAGPSEGIQPAAT